MAGLAAPLSPAHASGPGGLEIPVRCELGRTCFVQHHVDLDPGPGIRDFACGSATYDGHDGVDFRVLSAAAAREGVDVLAAADGRVLRVRDGVADAFAREAGKAAITDRECGNGVVVAHDDGLETQYCHLRQGTVVVRPGQAVRQGDPLGKVGFSGLADFAHVHFVVRRGGQIVDPFSGLPGGRNATSPDACRAEAHAAPHPGTLWSPATARSLAYRPAEIIQAGLSAGIPNWPALERDHRAAPVTPTSEGLVLFVRAINLAQGDELRFALDGPDGFSVRHTSRLERSQAIFVAGAGRRLRAARWPTGAYSGTVELLRGGRVLSAASAVLTLR